MSLLESSHRMHQNIRQLQDPVPVPTMDNHRGLSRRCRCWNPMTGCTKISAGCKASVPVPTMDNHRELSRRCRCWNPVTGCKASVLVPTMSLSDVVHRFKSLTTRKYINGVRNSHWVPFRRTLWQRSFYDHIIRNDKDLTRVREYIQNNPINWALDKKNLDNFTEST